jgi:hypothetical protein
VSCTEEDISLFFSNKEVPNIFETPFELKSEFSDFFDLSSKYEVKRSSSIFSIRSMQVCLEEVDLESLLKEIFLTNGRLLHHERLLCKLPEYLSL